MSDGTPIDSPCECEHNNPDSLDARLFPSVVLAVAPAVTMEGNSHASRESGLCSHSHGVDAEVVLAHLLRSSDPNLDTLGELSVAGFWERRDRRCSGSQHGSGSADPQRV